MAYPRICLGRCFPPAYSRWAHLLNLFFSITWAFFVTRMVSFLPFVPPFPFPFSLSLSLSYFKGAFVSLFRFCFFFFFFIFCSPLLLTSPSAFLPCYSVMLTSAFLYSYESRASFNTRGGILFRIEGGRRKEKMGRIGFLLFNSINGSSSKIHLF